MRYIREIRIASFPFNSVPLCKKMGKIYKHSIWEEWSRELFLTAEKLLMLLVHLFTKVNKRKSGVVWNFLYIYNLHFCLENILKFNSGLTVMLILNSFVYLGIYNYFNVHREFIEFITLQSNYTLFLSLILQFNCRSVENLCSHNTHTHTHT